jgi:hypothetical protein
MPEDPVRQYLKDLAKEGKVELVVTLRGHPDDDDFDTRAPACSVTIAVRDPNNSATTFPPTTKQFSRDSDRADRTFAVQAETVAGVVKRLVTSPPSACPRIRWFTVVHHGCCPYRWARQGCDAYIRMLVWTLNPDADSQHDNVGGIRESVS